MQVNYVFVVPTIVNRFQNIDLLEMKETKTTNQEAEVEIGDFGPIYRQFKGKAKEAFEFLITHENGDLLAVFHREEFGDVDLVWGNENGRLKHILLKHLGAEKSFVNMDDAACQIKEIIESGRTAFENIDKAVFQIGNKIVTVRKNFREKGKKIADKNWVLTAYDETTADGGSAITTSN